jgi:NAD(P)-dependent dehydrogenase (short-subunit alcohol dehydrogenase family)
MQRKWVIITGGNSGIGLALVQLMLKGGCIVGVVVRNKQREEAMLAENPFLSTYPNLFFFHADLSVQSEVVTLAHTIISIWPKVDVLFNHAGVLNEKLAFSQQDNEMHYEVQTIAPYLLATCLQLALGKSDYPLIVNTSTDGLHYIKQLPVSHLLHPTKFRKLFGPYLYSKLAQYVLFMHHREIWDSKGIEILFVSPGGNKTKMTLGKGMPSWMRWYVQLFYKAPTYGAKQLWSIVFDSTRHFETGSYVQNGKVIPIRFEPNNEHLAILLSGIKIAIPSMRDQHR